MAFLDASLTFSTAQSVTTTAVSTLVYDITSAGVGNPPTMTGGGGLNTAIGGDIGAGDGQAIPYVQVNIASAGGSGNTLTVQLQAAPDDGSYGEGVYTTLYQSAAIVESTIPDNYVLLFQVPPILQGEALPRFYRLNYVASAGITVVLSAYLTINPGNLYQAKLYPNNLSLVSA